MNALKAVFCSIIYNQNTTKGYKMTNQRLLMMLAGVFAMKKEYGNTMLPMVKDALGLSAKPQASIAELKELKAWTLEQRAAWYGSKQAGTDNVVFRSHVKPEEVPAGSIALIRVEGFISAKGDWCMKGLNDYEEEMRVAGTNKNIKGVILQVNSCGGSIEGVENFSNFVAKFETNYKKPLAAFIESQADSAGYYILCQAPRIFVDGLSSEAGSIGTMVSAYDYRPMLEAEGIFERIAYASKSVNKNKAGQDFLDGNNALMVQYIDKYNDLFLRTVRRGRPQLNTSMTITTNDPEGNAVTFPEVLSGNVYVGNEILAMGLADEITDLDGVVRYIESRAMQMGLGNGQSTIVETTDNQDRQMEMMDEEYSQTQLNITMYKNLSNEILQSQFESAKTDLNKIATEKGADSKEYQNKSNVVSMMEMELENRKIQASTEKLKSDFNIAQSGLTEKDAQIETLKNELKAAKSQSNNLSSEKFAGLETEKTALATEKENLTAQIEKIAAEKLALETEKTALTAEKETLTAEVTAHRDFITKQGYEMPAIAAVNSSASGAQPEGFKETPKPLTKKEQQSLGLAMFREQEEKESKN